MATPTAYTPPPPSLARDFVDAFFTLFVGVFLQAGRFVRLLALKGRRGLARRELFQQAVAMGGRMESAGAGDELLRQKLRACEPKDRDRLLAQLGELGLEPGVPQLGLEENYQAGHEAYKRCRLAERDHDEAAYYVWPHTPLGWFALLGSYVLTAAAAVLLIAFLWPDRVPTALARLVGHAPAPPSELPEVRFGDVKVEVIEARVGRDEVAAGNAKRVVDDDRSLFIRIRVTNLGLAAIDYQTWRGKFKAAEDVDVFGRVNDDRGRSLRRLVSPDEQPPRGGVRRAAVAAGESVEDVLVFGPPDAGFERLDLFLPGRNVGAQGQTKQLTLTAAQVQAGEAGK